MNRGKVLAIDYGKKSVGLATGDLEVKVAFPNDVVVNRGVSDLVEKILKVCEEYEVVLVVLGVPGSENAIVGEIEDFGRLLEVRGLKVEYVNEDYSSMEAEQMFDGVPHEGRFDDSKRGAEKVLSNATVVLAVLFALNSLAFLFV